jgi:hypothetical protein
MESIRDAMTAYIQAANGTITWEQKPDGLLGTGELDNAQYVAHVDEEARRCTCLLTYSDKVPGKWRSAVTEYVTRANLLLSISALEYDLDADRVVCRIGGTLKGVPSLQEPLWHLMTHWRWDAHHCFNELYALLNTRGRKPVDAARLLEERLHGPQRVG